MASEQRSFVDKRAGDTVINVVLGAVVALAVSMVFPMIGQALGGGVSGYLQQQGRRTGGKLGAIAAVLSGIPALIFVALVFIPFVFLPLLGAGSGAEGDLAAFSVISGTFLVVAVGGLLFSLVTAAVFGAVGGYVGAMLHEESTVEAAV